MSKATRAPVVPRNVNRLEAAAYTGIGPDLFDRAVATGLLPQPKVIFGRNVWDLVELDRAIDELPHRGDVDDGASNDNRNGESSGREAWLATQR